MTAWDRLRARLGDDAAEALERELLRIEQCHLGEVVGLAIYTSRGKVVRAQSVRFRSGGLTVEPLTE